MINNVLNLIDELQQLIDYEVVDTYRIKKVVSEAIRWLRVIPEGGVSYFESFHSCWIKEGYDPSWKFENQLSIRDYYKVIEILNESKTKIIHAPFLLERNGIDEIKSITTEDAYAYYNRMMLLYDKYKDVSLLKYGFSVINLLV